MDAFYSHLQYFNKLTFPNIFKWFLKRNTYIKLLPKCLLQSNLIKVEMLTKTPSAFSFVAFIYNRFIIFIKYGSKYQN